MIMNRITKRKVDGGDAYRGIHGPGGVIRESFLGVED